MQELILNYAAKLSGALAMDAMQQVPVLATALREAWVEGRSVFLCGNGGSAGNAIHLANDMLYGVGINNRTGGMSIEALSANPAVLTCLANDIGYDQIYSEQLRAKAKAGDILIVLSGSGNSPNVVKALETANRIGMETFAIVAFDGGRCKEIAQYPLHFDIDDMQIAEDLQLVIGHMCMQWLYANPAKPVSPQVVSGAMQ
ncbi:D-sedoheptulose 7-phosphate isomerase [Pararobbsia alpina]|uniref:SIS domain-containing protein n=1 Tax=Pararobbsia alpina TaxID=621374 RepID=UPI0039A59CF2